MKQKKINPAWLGLKLPAWLVMFFLVVASGMLCSYDYTDNRPASQNPPGGLSPAVVPMFVTIGFDDNAYSGLSGSGGEGGMSWATNFFAGKVNPAGLGNPATYDGQPASVTFYYCPYYIASWISESPTYVKRSWHTAMEAGHEVGNHTLNHLHGSAFSVSQWTEEIQNATAWLIKPFDPNEVNHTPDPTKGIGALASNIYGFRTPFLEYNNNTFIAIKNLGFEYDCSIEEGWQWEHDGSNYNWPYTLNSGSPGHDLMVEWEMKDFPLENHPGVWEMPPYPVVVPPDDKCVQYGVPVGLRAKMKGFQSWFDEESGKITGLDYNMFVMFKMTKEEFVATMKYTLDLRLQGNRCPLMFGAHSDEYSSKYTGAPNANYLQRQQAMEEFINYALSKPEVRVVNMKKILEWLRNPVPLQPVTEAKDDLVGNWTGSGIWMRNSDTKQWSRLSKDDAIQITMGDIDGDQKDDLVGWWTNPAGIWVRYSSSGNWEKIRKHDDLVWLSTGDINADGRDDVVGSFTFGVWWRNSQNNVWQKLHADSAGMIACGDFNNGGKDDLLGLWDSLGVWIRYSETNEWKKISNNVQVNYITTGDINGDNKVDVVGSWTTLGTWYFNPTSNVWTRLHSVPAEKLATGDFDGDKKDDLTGVWLSSPGVWFRYSNTGTWERIHQTPATWLTAGKMR